jgi:DNA modification methylase
MGPTEIKFRRDTSFRKALFSPDSFAHPAKMDAQLLLWIVERYTKAGDTILDPMAGSGTAMVGCTVGRNIVHVELEQKFVEMQKANWEKVRMMPQLGHEMGECHIIQGDARQLGDILADHAIFSPPYSNEHASGLSEKTILEAERIHGRRYSRRSFTGGEDYGASKDNISNLPYGNIDSIVTSPPYEASVSDNKEGPLAGGAENRFGRWKDGTAKKRSYTQHGEPVDSIITSPPYEGIEGRDRSKEPSWREGEPGIPKRGDANISQGYSVDSIVTSPPYEEAMGEKHHSPAHNRISKDKHWDTTYTERGAEGNIGNLKGDTYLSAMLQVYQQCRKVLKSGGLMIVVTKNFIRNKQEVKLDEDTIRLCEQAGFKFVERHYRKLPAQSFWRVIYQQKYPDAPILDKEDILVFQKEVRQSG